MPGITNLSHTTNKAILEVAILLTLALAAIIIIHKFQHVSAGSPSQGQSILLNASKSPTVSAADSSDGNNSPNDSSNSSSTKLTVNGKDIPVPQNGASSQTVPNQGGGSSQVDTNSQHTSTTSASGTATNNSNTSITVTSTSSNQGGDE